MTTNITLTLTKDEASILYGVLEEHTRFLAKGMTDSVDAKLHAELTTDLQERLLDGLFPHPTFPCRQGCGNEAAKFDTDCDVCAGK